MRDPAVCGSGESAKDNGVPVDDIKKAGNKEINALEADQAAATRKEMEAVYKDVASRVGQLETGSGTMV